MKFLTFILLTFTSLASFSSEYIDCSIISPLEVTGIDTTLEGDKPGFIVKLERVDASGYLRNYEFGVDIKQLEDPNFKYSYEALKRAYNTNTPVLLQKFKVSAKGTNGNAGYCLQAPNPEEAIWISRIVKMRNIRVGMTKN